MARFWILSPIVSELVAIACSVTSASTSYWIKKGHWNQGFVYNGLWWGCLGSCCNRVVWEDDGDHDAWGDAIKALVVLSILGSWACLLAIQWPFTKGVEWTKWAAAFASIQAIFLGAGLLTFVRYTSLYGNLDDTGWSFALGWVGVVFHIIAAIFFGIQGSKMRAAN